jgi:hypothetical protein
MKSAALAHKAAQQGITPVEYMLNVMREPVPEDLNSAETFAFKARALQAASMVAPYVHPRLGQITHTGPNGGPINIMIEQEDLAA